MRDRQLVGGLEVRISTIFLLASAYYDADHPTFIRPSDPEE